MKVDTVRTREIEKIVKTQTTHVNVTLTARDIQVIESALNYTYADMRDSEISDHMNKLGDEFLKLVNQGNLREIFHHTVAFE